MGTYNFLYALIDDGSSQNSSMSHDLAQVASAAKLLANGHRMGAGTVLTIDAQNSVTPKKTLLGNLTLADINISTKVV